MTDTLDRIFLNHAATRGEMLAISEKINRARLGSAAVPEVSFTRAATYVENITAILRTMGFRGGDIIFIQLPHLAETPLILLACQQAGLIPCLLPGHWRMKEISNAARKLKPSALLMHQGYPDHTAFEPLFDLALNEMSLRYIFGLGKNLPDGVTPLPTLEQPSHEVKTSERNSQSVLNRADNQLAIIGWSLKETGEYAPVAYTNQQIIANAVWLMARMAGKETPSEHLEALPFQNIMSPFAPTNLPGLMAMVCWVITGGALQITSTLKPASLANLCRDQAVDLLFLPEGLADQLRAEQTDETPHLALIAANPVRRTSNPAKSVKDATTLYNLNGLCLISPLAPPGEGLLSLGPDRRAANEPPAIPYIETRLQGAAQKAGGDQALMQGRLEISGRIVGFSFSQDHMTIAQLDNSQQHFEKTNLTGQLVDPGLSRLEIENNGNTIFHGNATLNSDELDQLYQAYPGFVDAAAFTIKDPLMGERLFAAIIPRPGDALSYDDFKAHLENQQISTAKIPEKLVMVSKIPRTAEGLIAREEILAAP